MSAREQDVSRQGRQSHCAEGGAGVSGNVATIVEILVASYKQDAIELTLGQLKHFAARVAPSKKLEERAAHSSHYFSHSSLNPKLVKIEYSTPNYLASP